MFKHITLLMISWNRLKVCKFGQVWNIMLRIEYHVDLRGCKLCTIIILIFLHFDWFKFLCY